MNKRIAEDRENRHSLILHQHQFDALVSFAYNPADQFHNVANFINQPDDKPLIEENVSPMTINKNPAVTTATSAIWRHHVSAPGTPEGFTVRTTFPANENGVEAMLEKWEAGSEEPPHSHPGDDMTVVVEGRMAIQFFTRKDGRLAPDGDRIFLKQGETGYIQAGRIHDAKYIEACKLVCVHDKGFGFIPQS